MIYTIENWPEATVYITAIIASCVLVGWFLWLVATGGGIPQDNDDET